MRRAHYLPLVVVLLMLAGPTSSSAASAHSSRSHECAHAARSPQQVGTRAARRAVVCLLNRSRTAHGLRGLRSDPRLRRAATRHSMRMARAKFFGHTTPAGTSFSARVVRTGYVRGAGGWALGENIGWGMGGLATPAAVVRSWMGSPGHRANILDGRFREIGVGIAAGAPVRIPAARSGAIYTTDFGVRR